jgi:hypothetical protein
MNPVILAAIITAGAVVLAAIIQPVIEDWLDHTQDGKDDN